MPTKAELETQVKTLKAKLKELTQEFKESVVSQKAELGENPHQALGLYYDGTDYKLVRINYNPENRACEIDSINPASRLPNDISMAEMGFQKAYAEEMKKRLLDELYKE